MAGLLEHTGMTLDEARYSLSIPELEGIFEGMKKNNTVDENGSDSSDELRDSDALRFLIQNGCKL